MLIEIPEDFEEDFMQLLIDQLHRRNEEIIGVRHDLWRAEAKLKELIEVESEVELLRQCNENQSKTINEYMKSGAKIKLPPNKKKRAN